MALNTEVLRERLKAVLGNESQQAVGEKLNMSQGNISKILKGSQLPTLETAYLIAGEYNVSVDWLLGLSDEKSIASRGNKLSYSAVAEIICSLYDFKMMKAFPEHASQCVSISINDPMLAHIIQQCQKLADVDLELLHEWIHTKLQRYYNLPLLSQEEWEPLYERGNENEEDSDEEWVALYEKVKNHTISSDIQERFPWAHSDKKHH